ncbi:hypothetical protein C8F01DRAFT_523756 [Mycena amicta]|nr:hypothetical protein C8F01DRAFT_523756 [Mycena amicta]
MSAQHQTRRPTPCSNCREQKIKVKRDFSLSVCLNLSLLQCVPSNESSRSCARCARKGLVCAYPDLNTRSSATSSGDHARQSSSSQTYPSFAAAGGPAPALPYTGPPPPNTRPRYNVGAYPALAISPHFASAGGFSAQNTSGPATGYDAYMQAYSNPQEHVPARLRAVLAGEVGPGMPLVPGQNQMHDGRRSMTGYPGHGDMRVGPGQIPMYSGAGQWSNNYRDEMEEDEDEE